MPAALFLFLLWFIPFLLSTSIAYTLRKHNRKIWPLVLISAFLLTLLFFGSENLAAAAKLYQHLTGHYNLEAAGFYLLYASRICGGFFSGTLTGYILQRLK